MTTPAIHFGTDGWRGVIAADFTFANLRRVAQATADYWRDAGLPPAAIVGYDTRFFSETFARLTCEVLAANGIRALCPPAAAPTPAVAHAVRACRLAGAVMITASHNPPAFSGFKIKAHYAGPADPSICAAIEQRLDANPARQLEYDVALRADRIAVHDPCPAHLRAIGRLVDLPAIRRARLNVVFDSMHGCGQRFLQRAVAGGHCRAQTIRAERDPLFGGTNPEPIGRNLAVLGAAVRRARAAVGLATDGDADRLGVVDERGHYVSIQLVFARLLLHLLRHRRWAPGLVVKSSNSTVLIDRICQAHGLGWTEVPVGFKHISEQMRAHDVLIGGEESGGLGFRGHIPERDGLLANLMLLESLAVDRQPLSHLLQQLQREFGPSAYDRLDLPFPLARRQELLETLRDQPPARLAGARLHEVKTFDGVKYLATDDAWLMVRASGTEPIIRIYAEADSPVRVRRLLELGRRLASRVASTRV